LGHGWNYRNVFLHSPFLLWAQRVTTNSRFQDPSICAHHPARRARPKAAFVKDIAMNYMNVHDHDDFDPENPLNKPDVPEDVQEAIRTLIKWSGDDPQREGLLDTPKRVGRAWLEYCQGYQEDPAIHLSRIFEEVGGYDEIVLLKDIPFQSHCEHHMAPITGKAAIAYLPDKKVVGISKLARVLHGFAQRLQIQERLTAQVAECIWDNLEPQGVAVVIDAEHGCMTGRGVKTHGVGMITSRMLGCFLEDHRSRKEVMSLMGYG
jgi:GTP cyclohydrolase I